MSVEEREVVVVGGGPVGLSFASSLNYYGIKTTLIEKKPTTSFLAKAMFLSGRSIEHFRRLGLEEAIQNDSFPRDMPLNITACTQALNGHYLLKEKLSSWGQIVDGEPGCKFLYYQEGASVCAPLMCPQPILEPIIKQHLEGSENVDMLWGWEVTSLEQDEEGVTLRVSGGEGEEKQEKSLRAKFVVACDGGSSTIRKHLNVHTYGKFVIVRAVSIMFKSSELFSRLQPLAGQGLSIVNGRSHQGVLVNLKSEGDYVIHVTLPPDTTDEEVEEIVRSPSQYVVNIVGENIQHTITAVSAYNMHGLMSTKFSVGRCFLAGDSAHQWLPAGGLGLNTGIGDAFNLAWKMAAVLKGYGGPHLLDSFEVERKPKCDATLRFALLFGGNAGAGSNIRGLMVSNPLTRFILSRMLARYLLPQFTSGQQLVFGYQYLNSNVIVHEYDPYGNLRFSNPSGNDFIPLTYPGLRAPHIVLPDCNSIIDLFGKTFVFLVVGGHEADCQELRNELEKRGVPLATHTYPKLPELAALYDRKYFLIRPDGIIAWRSDIQPSRNEACRIVHVIAGDTLPGRVSPFQLMKSKPSSPAASFAFDLLATVKIGSILHRYAGFSFKTAVGAGLGLFWLIRLLRMHPPPENVSSTGRHKAALLKQFGRAEDAFEIDSRFTQKFGANDILIRVHAASVNPIDVKVRKGYLSSLLHRIARLKGTAVFPILLGRDCSGEVVAVGDSVTKFVAGDQVYATAGFQAGTYAQLAVVPEDSAAIKPESVDHKEAAAIAFVAVTAYTALVENVGLNRTNTRGKKVLVHGGTGGVGSFAIQLLKAWGAEVTVTCSAENFPLAHSLGADIAIDYKQGDFSQAIQGYDVVLDTIGHDYEHRSLRVLKRYSGASYVSIINPRLPFLTKFGPILGDVVYSWFYRYKVILNRVLGGRAFYYSVANPNSEALQVVGQMVEKGEVKPLIDAVYSLEEIVAAHQHVEEGHTRGKVILAMP